MTTYIEARQAYVDATIPSNAIKVSDRNSDAIAYIYDDKDNRPCAALFCGRQRKPAARYRYSNRSRRETSVAEFFGNRRQRLHQEAEKQQKSANEAEQARVGDTYYTSWGYDQTNVDFYEIVERVGKISARVRPINSSDASTPHQPGFTGAAVPAAGAFKGPAILVRLKGNGFLVDGHYATRWDGRPVSWSAYH